MKYPFNKDTILSRPIKDENDLADVIVEMRKAIGSLLEANDNLRKEIEVLNYQISTINGHTEAEKMAESMRRVAPPSTPWPGTLTTTARRTASEIDALINPPIKIEGDTAWYDPPIGGSK